MDKFKIRCSSITDIMANGKGDNLSVGAQTYCKNWLKEQIYGRKKEFQNKYTDKGNIMEDNSLDMIADYLGLGMLIKNEQYFDNGLITGTPDSITAEYVIDVKNSWDCFTFPLFENEITNKSYLHQLQGYMHLTGKKKAKLIYTLMDTPEHLIQREAYYWCKNNGYDELDVDIYEKFEKKMTYKNIPIENRIKVYEIDYDAEFMKSVESRVIECRKFIETLK